MNWIDLAQNRNINWIDLAQNRNMNWIDLAQNRNMNWINLAQNRDAWRGLEYSVMKPSGSMKCGYFFTNWGTASFSRWTPFHGVS